LFIRSIHLFIKSTVRSGPIWKPQYPHFLLNLLKFILRNNFTVNRHSIFQQCISGVQNLYLAFLFFVFGSSKIILQLFHHSSANLKLSDSNKLR
jgi:hypothetical protein